MKILQKHVAKEILIPFALAFLIMTFLTLVGDLLHELARRFMNKGLSLGDMCLMILYALPTLATYTIPIALLFATLVAFVRFSQDCEIIAMQAAGIPIRRIFLSAILIGVAMALLMLALRVEISPWSQRKLKMYIVDMVLKRPTLMLNEQEWTPEVNNMRIFVGDIDDENMVLNDVSIMVSEEESPGRTIVAKSGKIYVDDDARKIFLELDEGAIHEYDAEEPDEYSTTTFSNLTIPVSIESIDDYIQYRKRYDTVGRIRTREMSTGQVFQRLSSPTVKPKERRRLLRLIGERTALAFMPLTFVLIGAPLGIIPYKARRFYGLAVCVILLLAYYSLLMLGEMLAKNGLMNPVIAMWIPNLLLGTAGVVFMIRAERR